MGRIALAAVVAAGIIGLVPAEIAALILAAVALLVSGLAYGTAEAVKRSYKDEMDRQSSSVRALRQAAADVDSQLRG